MPEVTAKEKQERARAIAFETWLDGVRGKALGPLEGFNGGWAAAAGYVRGNMLELGDRVPVRPRVSRSQTRFAGGLFSMFFDRFGERGWDIHVGGTHVAVVANLPDAIAIARLYAVAQIPKEKAGA